MEKYTLNKLKRSHKSGVGYKNTGKTNARRKQQSHGALGLCLSSGWTRIKLIELEMRSAGSHLGER